MGDQCHKVIGIRKYVDGVVWLKILKIFLMDVINGRYLIEKCITWTLFLVTF